MASEIRSNNLGSIHNTKNLNGIMTFLVILCMHQWEFAVPVKHHLQIS